MEMGLVAVKYGAFTISKCWSFLVDCWFQQVQLFPINLGSDRSTRFKKFMVYHTSNIPPNREQYFSWMKFSPGCWSRWLPRTKPFLSHGNVIMKNPCFIASYQTIKKRFSSLFKQQRSADRWALGTIVCVKVCGTHWPDLLFCPTIEDVWILSNSNNQTLSLIHQ